MLEKTHCSHGKKADENRTTSDLLLREELRITDGEGARDLRRPHPEHPGMEAFLEGVAVLPGPDNGHEAKSFQQVCQSCLGLNKAPLFRKELECSNLSSPAFLDSDPTVCQAFTTW